jgi:hypothetical protein
MRIVTIILLSMLALVAFAQDNGQSTLIGFTVTSFTPADNTTSVSNALTTVSVTFSAAIDTTFYQNMGNGGPSGGIISNLDSLKGITFSPDHLTMNLSVRVSAGKSYFVCIYAARSAVGGLALSTPAATRFTTAATFPAYSVSGVVSSGATGISTAYALVVLSKTPIGGSNKADEFTAGAIADAAGTFTVPYVPNDTLYTIAARDVNGDGTIDPSVSDIVGFGPNIIVNNANVTGVTITFVGAAHFTYQNALDSLAAHSAWLTTADTLRRVEGSGVDSAGSARNWRFNYTRATWQASNILQVDMFSTSVAPMDSNNWVWLHSERAITTLPTVAAVDTFLARSERNGGYAYRPVPMPANGFEVQLEIGDLRYSNFWDMLPDENVNYLGLTYQYYTQNGNNYTTLYQRRFLGNYTTGAAIATTGVEEQTGGTMPKSYALEQNYPNPFNPTSDIRYQISEFGQVRLAVFDLLGREVAVLVNESKAPGTYSARFNANGLSSGTYFYRLQSGNFVETKKMMLMK